MIITEEFMKLILSKNKLQAPGFSVIIGEEESPYSYLSLAACKIESEDSNERIKKPTLIQKGMTLLLKSTYQNAIYEGSFEVSDEMLSQFGSDIEEIDTLLNAIRSFNKKFLHKVWFIDVRELYINDGFKGIMEKLTVDTMAVQARKLAEEVYYENFFQDNNSIFLYRHGSEKATIKDIERHTEYLAELNTVKDVLDQFKAAHLKVSQEVEDLIKKIDFEPQSQLACGMSM